MPNKDGTGPAGKKQSQQAGQPQQGKRGGCNQANRSSRGCRSGGGRQAGHKRGQRRNR